MHTVPKILPLYNKNQINALRLLGRLGVMNTTQLARLAFQQRHITNARRSLNELLEDGLIGRGRAPHNQREITKSGQLMPIRQPHPWWLMEHGLNVLRDSGHEPDSSVLARMVVQPKRAPTTPRLVMVQRLVASWWCSALLAAVQASGNVEHVFIQTQFNVANRQLLDAFVLLRLRMQPLQVDPYRVPFPDGLPRQADEIDLRFGIIIDRGFEPPPVTIRRALTFRDLHNEGVYQHYLGGMITPITLVSSPKRAAAVAYEWRHSWPKGWGLVATPNSATSDPDGLIWGDYRSVMDGTSIPLLSLVEQSPSTQRVTYRQLIDRDAWLRGMCTPPPQA